MASGIVSDLSWCQNLQEQKWEKLTAVIRSKLFLHENENNTHEAEQALPAWRGAGRSSRGTRPLLSSTAVPVAFVFACGVCCCIAEEIQNKIIDRKTELCHHRPPSKGRSNEYENTHKEFQRWVSGCVVLEAFSSRARFICTTVVQIGVTLVLCIHHNTYLYQVLGCCIELAVRPRLNTYAHHTSYVRNFRTYFTVAVPAELTYVKALVRWATGKRLTNRLPKLSLVTLSPPLNSGILGHRIGPYVRTPKFFTISCGPRDSGLSDS